MPLFGYRCECGHCFELVSSFANYQPVVPCPKDGKPAGRDFASVQVSLGKGLAHNSAYKSDGRERARRRHRNS